MIRLILLAIAPVIAIAFYVYIRDKYEKEPVRLLLIALFAGIICAIPVLLIEILLGFFITNDNPSFLAFYNAFVVAGFTEELFKFLALFILIWKKKEFNEKFDGIVYAVFISLGFAGIENIIYVLQHGESTGYIRALVSVPGHALFGVTMGYYFGLAKFYKEKRKAFMTRALLYPIILHGIFDFILMLGNYRLLVGFIPYVIFLYIDGLRKMKNISERSIYRR